MWCSAVPYPYEEALGRKQAEPALQAVCIHAVVHNAPVGARLQTQSGPGRQENGDELSLQQV